MAAPHQQQIIIIKKKGGHGGHHGGAWKVAYADFVTAMMALFIVLWLMNSTPQVKKAISGYFKDPSGSASKTGSSVAGVGEGVTVTKTNMEKLKEKLEQEIKKTPEFQKLKDHVEMTITNEGLRIELLETDKGMFFQSGSPVPTPAGKDLLIELAKQLGPMKNPLLMEGHTDSQPYGSSTYTNWELSADRANAARRIMQTSGLETAQVTQVRGFADQRLRLVQKPMDASNRRISIIVQYPKSELAQVLGNDDDDPKSAKGEKSERGEKKPAGEGKGSSEKSKEAKPTEKASDSKEEQPKHG